jgi:hypothetical protein
MRKRKHTELAQPETRITFSEIGGSGLQETMGFVTAAYDTRLDYPAAEPIYRRILRSSPEMVMTGNTFQVWGRHTRAVVELPDNASDADRAYAEFVENDINQNMEGGFVRFSDTLYRFTPFFGFGYWEALPGVRSNDWTPPDGDTWRSEANDGLIGIRRLAYRDLSTFDHWEFDLQKRMVGMWQTDWTSNDPNKKRTVLIPLANALHLTYGDPNNPEGLTPLEAVYRIERIKYGLEVVYGIGSERAAGYMSVQVNEKMNLSADDKANIRAAAAAILTAQQGNYATWPFGISGEVKDVSFGAALACSKPSNTTAF